MTKSLSFRIWMWFIFCIVVCAVVISLITYFSLESFLKEQLYSEIEAQQQTEIQSLTAAVTVEAASMAEASTVTDTVSDSISHIVTTEPATELQSSMVDSKVLSKAASIAESEPVRYESDDIYFVVSNETIGNEKKLIYSYSVKNLRKEVLFKFKGIFLAIFGVVLFAIIPANFIAKRETKPLKKLKYEMERLAKREWSNPISLTGSQEFDNLANSCESMRVQLVTYDQMQQDMFQSFSHELKTPIMVIRSYIQSLKDGYYPKGSLESTLEATDKEALLLQKKVSDLVYITNLDYLAAHQSALNDYELNVKEIIREIVDRLKPSRTDLEWCLEHDDMLVYGDSDHWRVVFENIIVNALRYSKSKLSITYDLNEHYNIIRIYNDGKPINPELIDDIFGVFIKDTDGENGLGLYIVKRILDLYSGKVECENLESGVMFSVYAPKKREGIK